MLKLAINVEIILLCSLINDEYKSSAVINAIKEEYIRYINIVELSFCPVVEICNLNSIDYKFRFFFYRHDNVSRFHQVYHQF